ncbi:hypothetical protein [Nonomuraea sp. NPDC049400]|uniref:hypothetical protein n=1 Tax=Nonomuraea sp. NPDC049400 TaxID=3364352 RepID=UPI00378C2C7B
MMALHLLVPMAAGWLMVVVRPMVVDRPMVVGQSTVVDRLMVELRSVGIVVD